ncbi:MAG: Uma2 family endonuclease [Bacteroidetes bacterium QS_7_67_15]|nr:MAG: Uma2 family endonuclease [Bacteroidetes bacterium QS_7_67_15]
MPKARPRVLQDDPVAYAEVEGLPFELRRFTVAEYHALIEAGILAEGENVELLKGRIVENETYHLRRFSVEEYEAMIAAGVLYSGEPVELLNGLIAKMAAVGSHHAACVDRLDDFFSDYRDRLIVRTQSPIRLPDLGTEPEPDLALLRPREDFYETGHPEPDDVFLAVEVADRTAGTDRSEKIPAYAAHGLREAWLVDLPRERLEIYRDPGPDSYETKRTLRRGDAATPVALPDVDVPVERILGPGGV